jgi:hypothetical protein
MTKVYRYGIDGKLTNTEDFPDPPEQVAETSITDEAVRALASLRAIANGTGAMATGLTGAMTAAQTTAALRGIARVLIVLVRLQLRRFDGTD